jgi:threonine dehydrogenase-like Zn-dependent dehydrogenase
MSSRNALPADFAAIIRGMEAGLIDVRPWFTHRCAAAELPAVFAAWIARDSGLLKGVVSFAS